MKSPENPVLKTKWLSSRERELLRMPSISSQMPITFDNGSQLAAFAGECPFCNEDIRADLLLGVITRPMPSVATIEAVGICYQCEVVVPYLYRVYDDLRITGPRKDGWKTWYPKQTILSWLYGRLKHLFG